LTDHLPIRKTYLMTNLAPIPFVDLHAQYLTIKEEIDSAIAEVIASSAFIRGKFVDQFEEGFARLVGVSHCVSCANGSDALFLAMRALDIKPGDEVIVPAHSWISTASMVTHAGGRVVFCDTEADSFLIDVTQIESKITTRTVGIIPVHLFGQPADMNEILAIAKKHKLWVIEDCAQAHLATYHGKQVGTFGDAACFSFYPGKNLGAMGDAGAVVTSSIHLADRVAMIARHGGLTKNDHQLEGINSRMDGLQAAILSCKIPYLERWTERRRDIAAVYSARLSAIDSVIAPFTKADRNHSWHLYVIKSSNRSLIMEQLKMRGIGFNINYPLSLPSTPAYTLYRNDLNKFYNAENNSSLILSIPLYPELQHGQIERVILAVEQGSSTHN
jgi:dTDP-4-amino-4,6-dideoxygalactose transaminase